MSKCVPLCHQSALQLRFLCPEDRNEVQNLCTEWFPIEYPDSWYREITHSAKFYSLAAIYEHRIIGLIVAELKKNGKCHKEDQGILSNNFPKGTQLAYILSLGVVQDYRRNGIASLLLDNLIAHLTNADNALCKAVYLHVLTSNTTAIKFYEQRNFKLHTYLPFYYSINGEAHDGYSYVLYLNGGHPPWSLLDYFRHFARKLFHIEPCAIPKRAIHGLAAVIRRLLPGVRRIAQSAAAIFS